MLNCGVNTGLVGFGAPDANGQWSGFDVAVCRAVAAAVWAIRAVKFVPTTGETRFTALASGEIDMLARNSTWTFKRENDLKLDLRRRELLRRSGLHGAQGAWRYRGQGTNGATICVQTGTTTELNLADYFPRTT